MTSAANNRNRLKNAIRQQANRCFWCDLTMRRPAAPQRGQPVPPRRATREHFVPARWGGTDEADNIVAACHGCNNLRADRLPDEAAMRRFLAVKGRCATRILLRLAGVVRAELVWRDLRQVRR